LHGSRLRSRPRPEVWVPLALFAFALGLRVLVIALARFDGLYGQDAFEYLEYARRIFTAPVGFPPPGTFYWPLGYPMLSALFFHVTGPSPLGAQLASTLTGAAVAPLVYALARPLTESRRPAVAAGLAMAVSGQLIQSSISIMSDAPALFWATLSALALLRHGRGGRLAWLLASATTLGLAIVTRWFYVALIPSFAFAILPCEHRRPMLRVLLWGSLVFLIALPQVLFSQRSPVPFLNHGLLTHWSPAHAWRTSFDTGNGHFSYRLPPAIFYAYPLLHPFYLSPLLAPFVCLGAWRLRRSRELILILGWALFPYLCLCGLNYESWRFGLAYLPPVAVLAGSGLSWPWFALRRKRRILAACAFAMALALSIPFTYRGLASFLAIRAGEDTAVRFLQSRVPAGATVITFSLTAALRHSGRFEVVELFDETPETLRPLIDSGQPAFLLVDSENIERQWAGTPLACTVQWLREQTRLRAMGENGPWKLWAIDGVGSLP
jgi:4-amino-4-deoxy-L-arabinose transferase-like glycosyltransferase